MKKIYSELFGGIFCLLSLHSQAQDNEQEKWLNQKAAQKDSVTLIDANFDRIRPGNLKSSSVDALFNIALEQAASQENTEYNSSGGQYRSPDDATSVQMIKANRVRVKTPSSLTLTGDGVTILHFDSGRPLNSHKAFDNRVYVPLQDIIYYNSSTGKDSIIYSTVPEEKLHATLCSGIMVSGATDSARGFAPGAQSLSFSWDFTQSYLAEYAAKGINVACLPYGYVAGWIKISGTWYWFGLKGQSESFLFGFYSHTSKQWDELTWHAPYLLVVKSAGNDNTQGEGITTGTEYQAWDTTANSGRGGWATCTYDGSVVPDGNGNTDCISDIAVAKNILTVGALKDDETILEVSGRGPTDDLRIKPDVVANGADLYTTTDESTASYGYSSTGTSFAVSSMAGGVALLLEEQNKLYGKTKLLASTLKGLIIHTAKDKGSEGPDCTYGWGVPDITGAAKVIENNYSNHTQIHELTFTDSSQAVVFSVKKKKAAAPLKVTICWTDPAGTPPAVSIDPTDKMLVNDMDLRIINQSDNQVMMPWKLDSINTCGPAITGDNSADNVEQVIVNDTSTGEYVVKIYPKPGRISGKQLVSVIITGNDTTWKDGLSDGFESEYTSTIYTNDLDWVSYDDLKDSEASENTNSSVSDARQITTYPNPSTGKFTLNISNPEETQIIEILDIFGRTLYQKNSGIQTLEDMDISSYPDGLYLIKIQINNKAFIIKQIKKN
jgi:hypothetical protein